MPADLDFGANTDFSFSWWGQYTADSAHPDIAWLSNKDWKGAANHDPDHFADPRGSFGRWHVHFSTPFGVRR
jgi:hypothetical protein